ncbi:14010_t:CDS:2 [Ambispora leptoticha]|uniref:14010_t:CDS:1 n=1 Tax=Ambispora leptoticha TaxID=144679 RepID=A0A9N8YM45_9GLOM|nr:14010_t:CDS:2 [Ambispora leptoticha]
MSRVVAFKQTPFEIKSVNNLHYDKKQKLLSLSHSSSSSSSLEIGTYGSKTSRPVFIDNDPEKTPQDKQVYYVTRMKTLIARSQKSKLAIEFIKMKNDKSIQSYQFYNTLLQSCVNAANLDIALFIIKQMYTSWESDGIPVAPTKETYKILLEAVFNSKDYYLSLYIAKALINRRVPFLNKERDTSDTAIRDLPISHVVCDTELWQYILRALTSSKKLYSFWAVLSPFSTREKIPDFKEVEEITRQFLETTPKPFSTETWRVIIRGMGAYQRGGPEFVDFLQLVRTDIPINPEIGTEIIWALARKGLVREALRYISQAISKFGPRPLSSKEPIYALSSFCANKGNVNRTKELLSMMHLWVNDWALKKKWVELSKIKIMMRAYLQALANEVTLHMNPDKDKRVVSRFSTDPDDPAAKGESLIDSQFYKSWKELLAKLSTLEKSDRENIDLIIQFQVFANLLNHKSFPMKTAMETLKNMREKEVLQPEFNTFKIVLEGFANSPEFSSHNVQDQNQKLRIEYALEVFEMMKSYGYEVDKLETFRPLLQACLPPFERKTSKYIDSWGPLVGTENDIVWKKPQKPIPRIFEIEKMIDDSKLPIDYELISTLLEQLSSAGLFKTMWKRWSDLATSGIRRHEKLYETVFYAAAVDYSEAQYAINVVRNQMSREVPPVIPTLEIYTAMLQCCVRINDTYNITEITQIMQRIIDKTHNPRVQSKWYVPIVNAYLHNPELAPQGKLLVSQLLRNDGMLCFPLWRTLMYYYNDTHLDLKSAKHTFEAYVDWRERNKRFLFDSEKRVGIDMGTTSRNLSPELPLIKFPSSPLYTKDTQIINLYTQIAIRCGNFSIARQLLTSYVAHYEHQQAQDIAFVDIETLKEFAYLAWRKQQMNEMQWLLEKYQSFSNNDSFPLDQEEKAKSIFQNPMVFKHLDYMARHSPSSS